MAPPNTSKSNTMRERACTSKRTPSPSPHSPSLPPSPPPAGRAASHRTRWPAACLQGRPSPGGGPSRSAVSSPRSARAVARAASGFSNLPRLPPFPSSVLCLLQLSFWRRPPSRSCSRVGGGGGRPTAWLPVWRLCSARGDQAPHHTHPLRSGLM